MKNAEFQLRGVGDPRLAVHATSSLPAWLWAIDGTRILWANPVGARLFDARNGAVLATRTFGPANPHRRQVMQLAGRLPATGAVKLERLHGFGASLGGLMTCACALLDFSDGGGVLVVATAQSGRVMPLAERLRCLVEGIDTPIAAFAPDGTFVGASDAAHALLGVRNLADAGLEAARSEALRQGRVEMPIGTDHMVLQRVGSGADVGLVALIEPKIPDKFPEGAPVETPEAGVAAERPPGSPEHATHLRTPDYETAETTGEAPAEFALIDEFNEPAAPAAHEIIASEAFEPTMVPDTESQAAQAATPPVDCSENEPSPFIEAVADEPSGAPEASFGSELPPAAPAAAEPDRGAMPSQSDEPQARRHPLRFMWQMDAEGRFSLGSDEFTRLIGASTAEAFGRPWREITEILGLDGEGQVNRAVATRETWSGVTLAWPVDGGAPLPVELSGLPIYDRERKFVGYRGFGICRDLDGLMRLESLRRTERLNDLPSRAPRARPPRSLSADIARNTAIVAQQDTTREPAPEPLVRETSRPPEPDKSVDTSKNVLPFRPVNEAKLPSLSPVENNAFNELARQLGARLDAQKDVPTDEPDPVSPLLRTPDAGFESTSSPDRPERNGRQPGWLSPAEPPARGEILRDKSLLDLLPVGVLIYRLDRLLYANRAFLDRIGYASLQALEAADGLDALFVEPGELHGDSTSGAGTPVTIAATPASARNAPLPPTEARLFTISWDNESALALICSNLPAEPAAVVTAAVATAVAATPALPAIEPASLGHATAEELGAILDTTAEGVVMFDAEGNVNSCNRSAEALFGYEHADFMQCNLTDLFAPESQRGVKDYFESVKGADAAGLLDHGREVLGRARRGSLVPLSMTIGRTRPGGANFFAVFHDHAQARKSEAELLQARRQADRSTNAKADVLARISHEVRTPLNAIIGFAEVMIDERFGALGNERYVEYMKDIRASGERVIAIVNDLLDLSRIETGKIDLAFASQNLNELVESCVSVMQPQANRERIIIRTSLAHMLPAVVADARALRQIALNLIGNSIHLANAGGQVIVSTALSDFGEVVLRVRDTGHGLNDNELAAAMEPFRTQGPADQTSDNSGISLSLTKALVEANRAQFQIKTAPHSGTLIEVVFSRAAARG
jgi:PAS domain S-box-containing protein